MYVISLMVLIGGIIITPMTGDEWMKESRVLSIASVTWPLVSPLLDKVGIIPDIKAILAEARD
jgi:hypothetical protein